MGTSQGEQGGDNRPRGAALAMLLLLCSFGVLLYGRDLVALAQYRELIAGSPSSTVEFALFLFPVVGIAIGATLVGRFLAWRAGPGMRSTGTAVAAIMRVVWQAILRPVVVIPWKAFIWLVRLFRRVMIYPWRLLARLFGATSFLLTALARVTRRATTSAAAALLLLGDQVWRLAVRLGRALGAGARYLAAVCYALYRFAALGVGRAVAFLQSGVSWSIARIARAWRYSSRLLARTALALSSFVSQGVARLLGQLHGLASVISRPIGRLARRIGAWSGRAAGWVWQAGVAASRTASLLIISVLRLVSRVVWLTTSASVRLLRAAALVARPPLLWLVAVVLRLAAWTRNGTQWLLGMAGTFLGAVGSAVALTGRGAVAVTLATLKYALLPLGGLWRALGWLVGRGRFAGKRVGRWSWLLFHWVLIATGTLARMVAGGLRRAGAVGYGALVCAFRLLGKAGRTLALPVRWLWRAVSRPAAAATSRALARAFDLLAATAAAARRLTFALGGRLARLVLAAATALGRLTTRAAGAVWSVLRVAARGVTACLRWILLLLGRLLRALGYGCGVLAAGIWSGLMLVISPVRLLLRAVGGMLLVTSVAVAGLTGRLLKATYLTVQRGFLLAWALALAVWPIVRRGTRIAGRDAMASFAEGGILTKDALRSAFKAVRWVLRAVWFGLSALVRGLLRFAGFLWHGLHSVRLRVFLPRTVAAGGVGVAMCVALIAPVEWTWYGVNCSDTSQLLGLGPAAESGPSGFPANLVEEASQASWQIWEQVGGQTRRSVCIPREALIIAYSPEKGSLFRDLVERFNISRPRGTPPVVAVRLDRAEMLDAAAAGKVAAVSPDSTVWLHELERTWQGQNPGAASLTGPSSRFVQSPLVIAVRESRARKLGYPQRAPRWGDPAKAAADDPGFAWSHPAPTTAPGLLTVAALFHSGSGKRTSLTSDDVQRESALDYVKAVEATVRRYGAESEDTVVASLLGSTDRPLDAFVTQEQTVVSFNQRTEGERLVALYPDDGTFVLDHPIVLLAGHWVTSEHRTTFDRFAEYLQQPDQQRLAIEHGYRTWTGAASLEGSYSPIGPEHNADPAQPRTLLEIPPAELLGTIRQTWQLTKRPANIMLVADVSGSMAGDKIAAARKALLSFADQIESDNETAGLVAFAGDVREVVPLDRLGNNRTALRASIERLQPGGDTALYDAVLFAVRRVQERREPGRINAVVVMTDGQDNASKAKLEETLKAVHGADPAVLVFAVAYGEDADPRVLRQIAEAGGGQAYTSTPARVQRLYEFIAQFL